ncbi:hypothetical protein BDZ89DRAFT_1223549 [Hymenopellis radicata]|nr:hypothetical protein BDZ89DRAFT_1223549 [Hymenopellis radicata]
MRPVPFVSLDTTHQHSSLAAMSSTDNTTANSVSETTTPTTDTQNTGLQTTTSTTPAADTAVDDSAQQGWYSLSKTMKDYLRDEFAEEYVTFVHDSPKKGDRKQWIVATVLLPFLDKFFEGEADPPIDAISKTICRHFYNSQSTKWAQLKDPNPLGKAKPRQISAKRAYWLANKELVERRARLLKQEAKAGKESRSGDGWHHLALLSAWKDCPEQEKYEEQAWVFNESISDKPDLSSVYARQSMIGAILESLLKPLIGFGHNGVGKMVFGIQVRYEDAQGTYQYHDQFVLPNQDWLKLMPTASIITEETRKNFTDMITTGFQHAPPTPTPSSAPVAPVVSPTSSNLPIISTLVPKDHTNIPPISAQTASTSSSHEKSLEERVPAEAAERALAVREAEDEKRKKEEDKAKVKASRLAARLSKQWQETKDTAEAVAVADAERLQAALADATTTTKETTHVNQPSSSNNPPADPDDVEDLEAELKKAVGEDDEDDEDAPPVQSRPHPRPTGKKNMTERSPTQPPTPPVPSPILSVVDERDTNVGGEAAPEVMPDEEEGGDTGELDTREQKKTAPRRANRKRKATESPAEEPAAKANNRVTRASLKKAEEDQKKAAELQKTKAAAAANKDVIGIQVGTSVVAKIDESYDLAFCMGHGQLQAISHKVWCLWLDHRDLEVTVTEGGTNAPRKMKDKEEVMALLAVAREHSSVELPDEGKWKGRIFRSDGLLAERHSCEILWEVNELAFRCELAALDERLSTLSSARERYNHIRPCFPIGLAPLHFADLGQANHGLAHPDWFSRAPFVYALRHVMRFWKLDIVHTARWLTDEQYFKIDEKRGLTEANLDDVEHKLIKIYISSFLAVYGRTPHLPMILSHHPHTEWKQPFWKGRGLGPISFPNFKRAVRELMRRLGEDGGRLEGIGKAQMQTYQWRLREWEKQWRRIEMDYRELSHRVARLSDKIILEKRIGIIQLCLLLAVLLFMGLTRGSQNDFMDHVLIMFKKVCGNGVGSIWSSEETGLPAVQGNE